MGAHKAMMIAELYGDDDIDTITYSVDGIQLPAIGYHDEDKPQKPKPKLRKR